MPNVIKALYAETKNPAPVVTRNVDDPICPYADLIYLYQPGEQGGGKGRATDPVWSEDIHKIDYHIITQDIRLYYLKSQAPRRVFVKNSILFLLIV